MGNKVKIVGYAKKEFFGNGIEYRDFSPNLVGNSFSTGDNTSIFTSANFNITTNLESKVDKTFATTKLSNFMTLDNLNVEKFVEQVVTKYSNKVKLNLDYDDVLSYAFFGSLKEYIRVSLENVITKWPASLFISKIDNKSVTNTGDTVTNYAFDPVQIQTTFEVNVNRIQNPFEINYLSGGTIENTFNETNGLRNIVLNYSNYILSNTYGDFKIVKFLGAQNLTTSKITLIVEGNPFPNFGFENINYHIKPNSIHYESFFFNLNEFENKLLNRLSIPAYTSNFKVYDETENGTTIESKIKLTWPVTDGYNIDFNSIEYMRFVGKLLEIAETNDDVKSNLMVRFLVSQSISEFDSIPDINGTYTSTNGQKMTSALKIYGREFDEIKNYSDGIAFANVVTYDKKNNTPDIVLKNLARVLGWELTTSITEIDIVDNFLSLNDNNYSGYSRGLSKAESEVELWRRIIMNTPWLWKSKGTRKAIEFLLKFIGAPDGLVSFNEYLYIADEVIDMDLTTEMMEYFNDTSNISDINIDSEGFPRVFPNTTEMYFQKAGLWYRQTGGPNPDIDILTGNNPHIGPYDGGQEYINQFTNCLIPNFSGGTGKEVEMKSGVNLFTNNSNGTFDECCSSAIIVDIITNQNLQTFLNNNQSNFIDNSPVIYSGCNITNNWTLITSLTGETINSNTFLTTSGSITPTEIEYINAIKSLTGTTELNGITFEENSNGILRMRYPEDGCDSNVIGKFFKLELCVDSDYDCEDEGEENLVEFLISDFLVEGCDYNSPLPLLTSFYHNGPIDNNGHPMVGNTIYTDNLGLHLYISSTLPRKDVFMGGDPLLPENYLRTDSNGIRVLIDCI